MAQTNNTTLQLYYSPTAAAVPTAGNLAFGELAINILDEKLYFKNSSGVVKLLASPTGATGTVQSVSVVSANGLAGTVATATTTPAITLSTTITGVLKGNGTAISAAVSGTDYAPATSGTSILKGNGSGGFSNATSGTDYAPATTGSDILYGNGAGGFSPVTVSAPLTFVGGALGLGAVTAGTSILYGDGAGGISNVTIGSGVSFVGGTLSATGAGGTVTSVSVASANGFAGSSSGGATPALTISTSITGLLKGNGTAVSAATSGTDYVVPSGNITGSAGSVATTNWTISETGGKLYFAYGGVNKGSLDSTGNFIVTGNVTAYGTP